MTPKDDNVLIFNLIPQKIIFHWALAQNLQSVKMKCDSTPNWDSPYICCHLNSISMGRCTECTNKCFIQH